MGLNQYSTYDYNGVIFIFGAIDKDLTTDWSSITRVTLSVDGTNEYYSAQIKNIQVTETTNPNNSERKVFNINTYTHRVADTTNYQFSSGTHNCTLRFYADSVHKVSATVTVKVHATLATPTVSYNATTGDLIVSRSQRTSDTRYFLEIRRRDRSIINPTFTAEEKDYAHTVAMRGLEGGKYNEGSPHTSFLRYPEDGTTAGSELDPVTTPLASLLDNTNSTGEDPVPLSLNSPAPDSLALDTVTTLTWTRSGSQYFTIDVPGPGLYSVELLSYTTTSCYLYLYSSADFTGDYVYSSISYGASPVVKATTAGTLSLEVYSGPGSCTLVVKPAMAANISPDSAIYIPAYSSAILTMASSYGPVNKLSFSTPDVLIAAESSLVDNVPITCISGRFMAWLRTDQTYTYNDLVVTNRSGTTQYVYIGNGLTGDSVYDTEPYLRINDITKKTFNCLLAFDEQAIYDEYGKRVESYVVDALSLITNAIATIRGVSMVTPTPVVLQDCILNRCMQPSWSTLGSYEIISNKISASQYYSLLYIKVQAGERIMGTSTLYLAESLTEGSAAIRLYPGDDGCYTIDTAGYLLYESYQGSYTPTVFKANTVNATKSGSLYYIKVNAGTAYRVSRNHDTLYWGTSISKSNTITGSSDRVWYETVYNTTVDSCSLVVGDNAYSTTYIVSSSPFYLEAIMDCWEAQEYYNTVFDSYAMVVRIGLDGTLWMGGQGVATSKGHGTSADINGEGVWYTYRYYEPSGGVSWSMANIALDASDLVESISHVIHEEMAQSLGVGNDCYSHEESIHWDPAYANPDYYTGIDYKIWQILLAKDYNGYNNWQLLNELDLPALFFKEYTEYSSSAGGYVFKTKDPTGRSKLRSGTYDVYAWCAQHVSRSNGGDQYGSWDQDPYSLRSTPLTITVEGGWYWSDHGVNMAKGLLVSDVPYTVWNSFVDATSTVMGSGSIPAEPTNYGSGAGLPFDQAIQFAKCSGETPEGRTLYAQRFNIVNYIINASIPTGIPVQESLLSQVLAEYLVILETNRNNM